MSDKEWQKVAAMDSLEDRIPTSVKVDGKEILLVRIGETVYATRGKCPHYGAPLKKGLLSGCEITCPWHHARFDISTGALSAPPALDGLTVYPTRVENGDIFVGSPEPKTTKAADRDDRTFVILGAGAAGNAAAETLRLEGFPGKVLLITAESSLPYDRPNLSKDFLSGEASMEWMPLRKEAFYEKRSIELLTGREVRLLNPEEHAIHFSNGDVLNYDRVLIATGGTPRRLSIPGGDFENVFVLRSMDDAGAIVEAAQKAQKAVVLGSGFIGLEAAAALRHRNLKVDLVTQEDVPMGRVFGEQIGQWLRQMHESQGVQFHFGSTPQKIEKLENGLLVHLSDGSNIEADFVLVGFGVDPAVDFLKDAGLVHNGAVAVNERLQTKSEDIFAAGDIALFPYAQTGTEVRIEHWAVAEAQGMHAARAMLGSNAPYGVIPFFWTRQFGKSIKYIGYAASYDRVVYRGRISDEYFFAGYFLDGRLQAASSFNGGNEFAALGELMRAGDPPSVESFEDPDFSFIEVLAKRS